VDHSIAPVVLGSGGTVTWVKSQWKSGGFPGQFRVEINSRSFDCGAWARTAVRRLIGDGPVRCAAEGIDQYDRVLAECFTSDGASINLVAVREGIAFVYDRGRAPRRFLEAEDAAKADRVGVWAAVVDHPRDHRRGAG
jgi:endonuclease YncB( thermonuclease family)